MQEHPYVRPWLLALWTAHSPIPKFWISRYLCFFKAIRCVIMAILIWILDKFLTFSSIKNILKFWIIYPSWAMRNYCWLFSYSSNSWMNHNFGMFTTRTGVFKEWMTTRFSGLLKRFTDYYLYSWSGKVIL